MGEMGFLGMTLPEAYGGANMNYVCYGLVAREVLKYPDVQGLTLVDIDPAVTHMAQTFGPVVTLNQNSLNNPRVHINNQDGYKFLADSSDLYQVIIGCKQDRPGFFRAGNMDCIHTYDTEILKFFCP